MVKILIIVGGLFAVIFIVICKAVIAGIKEMQAPDTMFVEPPEKIDDTSDTRLKHFFDETNTWAKYHGFKFTSFRDFLSKASSKIINIVFWLNEDKTCILAMYYVEGKIHYDFVSKFENNRGLTTSSTKDGAMLPTLPEDFAQYFPGLTLNETWEHHLEAEQFIEKKLEYSKVPFNEDIISEVKESIRKQAEFIKSLFLWQLRGPYWFFVRKNIVSNKKITEKLA